MEKQISRISSFVAAGFWLAVLAVIFGFMWNCATEGDIGRKVGINAPYVRVLQRTRPVGIGLSSEKGLHVLKETDYRVELKKSFDKK